MTTETPTEETAATVEPPKTTEVVERSDLPAQWHASEQDVLLLKKTMVDDRVTMDEFKLFMLIARRVNLDPFRGQIYCVKYKDKIVPQTGIDGYRALAVRTQKLDGQDDPLWYDENGKKYHVWTKDTPPFAARAAVYRKGVQRPFVAVVLYRSFVRLKDGQPMNQWRTMPEHMLFKCATAQALRAAFPDELAGVYTSEEMEQAASESLPPSNPEIVTKADVDAITSAWKTATHDDRVRAIDWLKTQGFTGSGESDKEHVRVLNDFSERGKHSRVVDVTLLLAGGDAIIEGDTTARFDPDAVADAQGKY